MAVKEAYARLLPNAQLIVIPNAHHAVPVEQPQEFNRVLAEFLVQHS